MSDTQSQIDELVAEFDAVEEGELIHLTTDGGAFDCRVCKASMTDERAELFLRRPDGAQVHAWTRWIEGWLDPLVDVLPAAADEGRTPLGTLVELQRPSRRESEKYRQR